MNRDGHMVYANKARRLYLSGGPRGARGSSRLTSTASRWPRRPGVFFFDGKETGVQMLYGQARGLPAAAPVGALVRAVFVLGVHEDLKRDSGAPGHRRRRVVVGRRGLPARADSGHARRVRGPDARFFADADRLHRLSRGPANAAAEIARGVVRISEFCTRCKAPIRRRSPLVGTRCRSTSRRSPMGTCALTPATAPRACRGLWSSRRRDGSTASCCTFADSAPAPTPTNTGGLDDRAPAGFGFEAAALAGRRTCSTTTSSPASSPSLFHIVATGDDDHELRPGPPPARRVALVAARRFGRSLAALSSPSSAGRSPPAPSARS